MAWRRVIFVAVAAHVSAEEQCQKGSCDETIEHHTSLLQMDLSVQKKLQPKVEPYFTIGAGGRDKCEDSGLLSLRSESECFLAARYFGFKNLHKYTGPFRTVADGGIGFPENPAIPAGCSFEQGTATEKQGVEGATGVIHYNEKSNPDFIRGGGWMHLCRTSSSTFDHERDIWTNRPRKRTNILNPLPTLEWLTNPIEDAIQIGDLEVPLNPDDDVTPYVKVRIHARLAGMQPAALGALIIHCGGPEGSGADCLDKLVPVDGEEQESPIKLDRELFKLFDIIAIDQRGVGASYPQIQCTDSELNFTLPALGKSSYTISDFTSCACYGISNVFADTTDEAVLLDSFTAQAEQLKRCYDSPKFQLENGYNFLDYVGTEYLAHDYEALRIAIGATKLSFYGANYGAFAGAAYASHYPSNVNRIVLDSSVAPRTNPHEMANDFANMFQQSVQEMVRNCEANASCAIPHDPYGVFSRAVEKLQNNEEFYAKTDLGDKAISPTALVSRMVSLDYRRILQPEFLQFMQAMASLVNESTALAQVTEDSSSHPINVMLDDCQIPISKADVDKCVDADGVSQIDPVSHMCKTWKQYGICLSYENNKPISNIAIIGADTPGRYFPSQWLRTYQNVHTRYGPFGGVAALHVAGISLWPAPATPVIIGHTSLQPVIIRALHDSQIGTEWAQVMHSAFPAGSIMNWQDRSQKRKAGLNDCPVVRNYLISGDLPANGFVCYLE